MNNNTADTHMDTSCILCKTPTKLYLSYVRDPESNEYFKIQQCQICQLEITHPQPACLELYYRNQYYGNRHGITSRLCIYRRLRWINKFKSTNNPKLLDVGCGDGTFLLAAVKHGWQVYGTEINSTITSHNKLHITKTLHELKTYAPFNCITLWHSLEHMTNPNDVISNISSLLTNDGHLIIAVPNATGLQSKLFGKKWLHRDVPRHLFHFNKTSLNKLLTINQFKIYKSWHKELEYDLMGWTQSALNYLFKTPNVFLKIIMRRKQAIPIQLKFLNYTLGILFTIISLPLTLLSSYFKSGGTLVIAATKQSKSN